MNIEQRSSDLQTSEAAAPTATTRVHGPSNSTNSAPPPTPSPAQLWWQVSRPQSLTATTTPVAVGIALAALDGTFSPGWALLTLAATLLLQIGTNMVNEYYDFKKGVDPNSQHSLSQVVRQGLLTPEAVIRVGMLCFALGAAMGVALALHGGSLIWALGVLGILIGFFYTAGPYPLAYLGLGEIGVFIAMGPGIVVGTYIVQTSHWSWAALVAGVPIGFLVAAIMHANNLRDLETDRAQHKRTLAARFGRTFARREYIFLVGGTYVALLLLALFNPWLTVAGIGTLFMLPMAAQLIRTVTTTEDQGLLNGVLRGTARLHGRFGALWAIGLLATAAVRYVSRS